MIAALAVAALAALYLWLIAPGRRGKDVSGLLGFSYAHRGLFDNDGGVPENSLAAFSRAADLGYGMELDVQMTADGQLVVFHDETLVRMCGVDARLNTLFYKEASQFPLLGTGERIPLLSQVLKLVDGRVPLIVEIKPYGDAARLAQAVHAQLCAYSGAYCVESFHPLAMAWFKRHAPQVVRGQLASGAKAGGLSSLQYAALKYLLVNALSRPDFIAYDVKSGPNVSTFLLRRLFSPLWAAWTVKSPGQAEHARKMYDLQIFEGFLPER